MQRTYRTPKGTDLPLLNLRGREYLEVKYRLVWFREEHPDWSIETEILSLNQDSAYARATIKDETGRIIATSHKFENRQGFPDFIEKSETGAIGRALALIGYGTQFAADELDEGERIVDAPIERRPAAAGGSSQRASTPRPEGPALGKAEGQAPRAEGAAGATAGAAVPRGFTPSTAPDEAFVEDPFAVEPTPLMGEEAVREGKEASLGTHATGIPKDPGEYRISFGRKYKGMRLKDIPRSELEGYVDWLEENASKKGLPLSEEARFLKVAVTRFFQQSSTGAGSSRSSSSQPSTEGPSH